MNERELSKLAYLRAAIKAAAGRYDKLINLLHDPRLIKPSDELLLAVKFLRSEFIKE